VLDGEGHDGCGLGGSGHVADSVNFADADSVNFADADSVNFADADSVPFADGAAILGGVQGRLW
jgi:hypothetical protein